MVNMTSSFTALPPEIRSIVYNLLLHDTLSNNHRLIYDGFCPSCITTTCQEPDKHAKVLPFASRKFNADKFPRTALYVHLADFGHLLRLGATCKVLRSEILGLVWSNADIFIKSDNLAKTLSHIFDDCLSTDCCNFIRTLKVDIPTPFKEQPDHTKQIVRLIHHRLPQLEKLILYPGREGPRHRLGFSRMAQSVFASLPPRIREDQIRSSLGFPHIGLSVLASLPLRISVEFRSYGNVRSSPPVSRPQPGIIPGFGFNPRPVRECPNQRDNELLHAVRSNREKRKQKKAEKKRRNEAVDGVEGTVETHSFGLNNQLSRTNTEQELGVENALEVTKRLRSLMLG
ncbi:hypothetical protein KCU65_g8719, partial [Aureobasidium melanogenum]